MARDLTAQTRENQSRAARTARGALGAFAATLLAAASHALAGGQVTLLALVATAVLALPLCVALAGRVASVWRVSLGVSASQFIYHWSFAGLGVATGSAATASPEASGHVHQLGATSFVPALTEAGAAGWTMWIAHALAAIATIALLASGERAILGLGTLLARLLPTALHLPVSPLSLPAPRGWVSRDHTRRDCLVSLSAISHRGPPVRLAPAS
ncbi:hypothetical protein [Leucobacter sp. W1153]|uniref:hypothetical protein n=1 Tax=unclassified Leucobacter TaxID=2621730 RepID=UPI003F410501